VEAIENEDPTKYLSPEDAAVKLGLSKRTVIEKVREGKLAGLVIDTITRVEYPFRTPEVKS